MTLFKRLCLFVALFFGMSSGLEFRGFGMPLTHGGPELVQRVKGRIEMESTDLGIDLFSYEKEEDGPRIEVRFTSKSGDLLVHERCEVDPRGFLLAMKYEQNQFKEKGEIRTLGNKISFEYESPSEKIKSQEDLKSEGVVAPCTLGRFLENAVKEPGVELPPTRLALIERQETVGIEIYEEDPPKDLASLGDIRYFRAKPQSLFISFLFPKISFVMDAKTRKVLSFLGPLPVKLKKGDGWEKVSAKITLLDANQAPLR